MTFYRIEAGDGAEFHELRDGEPLPAGAVPVDRRPGPFEDFVDGQWITDERGLADWRAGSAHIAEARAIKFLEAQLIAAGIELPDGLLVLEAADKGLPVKALAGQVIEKRTEFVTRELERQAGQARGDAAKDAG